MLVKTAEQKKEFYKSLLRDKDECFVICTHDDIQTPLFIKKSDNAETGFFELECELYAYTFTKGNASEEKFMKEQGYIVIDDLAYDIQTPFVFFEFDKYLGDFAEITKKDCVIKLKEA